MIIALVKKEMKRTYLSKFKSIKSNVFATILNVAIGIILFAFVLFLFNKLNVKFLAYNVSDKLLILFTGLVVVIYTLVSMNNIDKELYDSSDLTLVLSSPIKNSDIVISKSMSFYLKEFISMTPVLLALFISYGVTNSSSAIYYVVTTISLFLYPLYALLFSSLLSWPYHYLKQFLKNHTLVQLLFSLVIVIGFSYLYSQVLDIFIELVNDGRLSYLFNQDNIAILDMINHFMIPSNLVVNVSIGRDVALNLSLLIGGAILATGGSIFMLIFYYSIVRKYSFTLDSSKSRRKYRILSSKLALFKKEMLTFFRNSNYLFVYCTLLLSVGFINYAVCSSLKVLVNRFLGTSFSFFPFALLICGMFSSVVNGIGASVISKEKKNAIWLKTMPMSYKTQVFIKYLLLMIMMTVSLVITCLMLGIGKILPIAEVLVLGLSVFFLVGLVLTTIVSKDISKPQFSDSNSDDSKMNYSLVLSLVVPLLFSLVSFGVFYFTSTVLMLISTCSLAFLSCGLALYEMLRKATKGMQMLEVNL